MIKRAVTSVVKFINHPFPSPLRCGLGTCYTVHDDYLVMFLKGSKTPENILKSECFLNQKIWNLDEAQCCAVLRCQASKVKVIT